MTGPSAWLRTGTPVVLVLAVLAVYGNALGCPFVFLDVASIVDNPTIRHLWPLGPVLSPPVMQGLTVGGRPLVNLSLALNYACGGVNPWGYHAVNVGIHALAVLTLYGVVRRTMEGRARSRACGSAPGILEAPSQSKVGPAGSRSRGIPPYLVAFAVALLWAVHPLQTESVTYVIQRAESLMGLFYLLTLYCFIRGWPALTVLACLFGVATKEVMVSAPVIVFLYDRTFLAGTFAEAWRRRRGLYLALAATWIPLAAFVASTGGNRGGTSGWDLGVSWGSYALTQFPAVMHYLRLAFWPHPLVFYYAVHWQSAGQVVGPALGLGLLVAATLVLFFSPRAARFRWLGFLGLWFFAILAPTSLIPGMSQTLAEHRMYLALAPVLAVAAIGGWSCLRDRARGAPVFMGITVLLALGWGGMTVRRNHLYSSEVRLWTDTVAKVSDNPYTQNNLGIALAAAGRPADAIVPLRRALALKSDYPEAHDNLGLALAGAGRLAEAIAEYERALALKANYPEARANLGIALASAGRIPEAIEQFTRAVALNPGYAVARNNLAVVLAGTGRLSEAIEQYEAVLRLAPNKAETHYNLANALAKRGRGPEAIAHYERALQLLPAYAEAAANLGAAYANAGRYTEAAAMDERALALTPNDPDLHYNLGLALRALGRDEAARGQFAIAARLQSGH